MTITASTRWAAVVGAPVDHSLSPALHNAAFTAAGIDAVYLALHVEPAELAAAISGVRALRPLGLSITVPHKQAILPLLDRVEPLAARIGAVNCVVVEPEGAVVGYNTDANGFVDGLDFEVTGLQTVVLGSGGAARAVGAGLQQAGATVSVVARRPDRVDWAPVYPWTASALCSRLGGCDLLVDCTSVGLSPAAEASLPAAIPVELLPRTATVATLVYHRETALLAAARERGLRVVDGSLMLLHQGARAFALWTGMAAPLDAMRAGLASGLTRELRGRR